MLSAKPAVDISNPLGLYRTGSLTEKKPSHLDQSSRGGKSEEGLGVRSSAYLSPPMSGSSPHPPHAASEASSRVYSPMCYADSKVGSNNSDRDANRASHAYERAAEHQDQSEATRQPLLARPLLGPATGAPGPPSTMSFAQQRRPYDALPRLASYPQPDTEMVGGVPSPHGGSRPPSFAPTPPGPLANTASPYPFPTRPSPLETHTFESSKAHRKTKGHVASACVPCKRAHLRCDSQRPCSRCLGNGKADACVDVQHKKRGRPRLRDDREARYDPSRYGSPQDMGMRRPISAYPTASPITSHGSDIMSRHGDRNSPATSHPYSAGPPGRGHEPVAYLTMDLVIASASPAFLDAIGRGDIRGRKLADLVAPVDGDRTRMIQNHVADEQKGLEPNYLPPILGRGDQIMQALTFSPEEVARFKTDCHEYLTFVGHDGHPRHHAIRFGLAKQESYFFVVVVLNQAPRPPYLWPTPHQQRDPMAGYPPPPPHAQARPTTFTPPPLDPTRQHQHRFPEPPMHGRQLPDPKPTLSPGVSPGPSTYSHAASRSDGLQAAPYDVPRSEVQRNPPRPGPVDRSSSFQLPPIRSQPSELRGNPGEPGWPRDGRSGRVDIGGLLEKRD